MRLEVKAENLSDEDMALQIESFTRRVVEAYPIGEALLTIRRWPDGSRFWPAWRDLKQALDERMEFVRQCGTPRLSHAKQPLPGQREQARREERWARMTDAERLADHRETQAMLDRDRLMPPSLKAELSKLLARAIERYEDG